MTKKFLSFAIAGTLAAAPMLSFAETMTGENSSSSSSSVSSSEESSSSSSSVTSSSSSVSSSSSSKKNLRPCAGLEGRDQAACLRVRTLKNRAQRIGSKLLDRKEKRKDEKLEKDMEKEQKSLRKLLRRQVNDVTKACGTTRGLERIQCIKDQRNSK